MASVDSELKEILERDLPALNQALERASLVPVAR
jgi:hypothetical protein